MNKPIKIIIAGFIVVILFGIIFLTIEQQKGRQEITHERAKSIVVDWLLQIDPRISQRCKIILEDYSCESNQIKVNGFVCGNVASFWVNKKTGLVECYTTYLGNETGKKICF